MSVSIDGTTNIVTGDLNGNISGTVPNGSISNAKLANSSVSAEKLSGAQTGAAPIYGCRAWVNFDATRNAAGATDATNTNRFIRASGNVATVLRNAAGDFTVTFTTAMDDANYAALCLTRAQGTGAVTAVVVEEHFDTAPTTSAFRLNTKQGGTRVDTTSVHVSIFR